MLEESSLLKGSLSTKKIKVFEAILLLSHNQLGVEVVM